MAVVAVKAVMAERTAALVRLEVPVLGAALPVAAAAAAELLPELLDLLLDAEQRVVGLLLDGLDDGIHAADDDVARGALDELDLDLGQALVEDAADLEELEVDGDEGQLLLGVADLGLDEEAVAERLLLARAVVGLDLGRQVAVPGVRGGVQLEAVERQAAAALDEEVEADGGIRAALLVVGDVEVQVRGHQNGVSRVDRRREGADNILVGLGDLGDDEEGGGRRREAELSVQHGSGLCTAVYSRYGDAVL